MADASFAIVVIRFSKRPFLRNADFSIYIFPTSLPNHAFLLALGHENLGPLVRCWSMTVAIEFTRKREMIREQPTWIHAFVASATFSLIFANGAASAQSFSVLFHRIDGGRWRSRFRGCIKNARSRTGNARRRCSLVVQVRHHRHW